MALILHAWVTTGNGGSHDLAFIEIRRVKAEVTDEPMEYEVTLTQNGLPLSVENVWHRRKYGWEALASTALAQLADAVEQGRTETEG